MLPLPPSLMDGMVPIRGWRSRVSFNHGLRMVRHFPTIFFRNADPAYNLEPELVRVRCGFRSRTLIHLPVRVTSATSTGFRTYRHPLRWGKYCRSLMASQKCVSGYSAQNQVCKATCDTFPACVSPNAPIYPSTAAAQVTKNGSSFQTKGCLKANLNSFLSSSKKTVISLCASSASTHRTAVRSRCSIG